MTINLSNICDNTSITETIQKLLRCAGCFSFATHCPTLAFSHADGKDVVVYVLCHLIHTVPVGLPAMLQCYIKARPSSSHISIFRANRALALLAWQNVTGRRQLGAKF